MEPLFHLSIPVDDLDRAKAFYVDMLGCELGRKASSRDRKSTRLNSSH